MATDVEKTVATHPAIVGKSKPIAKSKAFQNESIKQIMIQESNSVEQLPSTDIVSTPVQHPELNTYRTYQGKISPTKYKEESDFNVKDSETNEESDAYQITSQSPSMGHAKAVYSRRKRNER